VINDSGNVTFEVIRDLPITRNQTLEHFVHVAYENIIMIIIMIVMNNYDRDIGVVDKYSNDITKVVIIKAINELYRRNSHILLLIYTQQCLYHHQPG
jgi:cobalamin biosynthesis Co2+ chelatase CbiK